jgi:tyrosinase
MTDSYFSNIDRLTAIWQELNENLWFNDPAKDDPCPKDWLKPFHTDKTGGQWSSTMTKDRKKLGYDYDDLVPAEGLDVTKPEDKLKYLQDLRTYIDNLYPHTAKAMKGAQRVDKKGFFDDYVLNVAYDRLALNGRAYAIVFYLEDMSVNPEEQQHTHIGTVYTFSAPVASCSNCRKQQEQKVLSRAQIPLTTSLLAMSRVGTPGIGPLAAAVGVLDRETVAEVIKNQLKWQFVELGGKVRPATDFPDTAIKVQIGSGYAPDSSKNSWGSIPDQPTYGGYAELKTAAGDSLLGDDSDNALNDLIPDD